MKLEHILAGVVAFGLAGCPDSKSTQPKPTSPSVAQPENPEYVNAAQKELDGMGVPMKFGKGGGEASGAQVKDELLEKAQELLRAGNRDAALAILNSYRTDNKQFMAVRKLLFAEAKYMQLQEVAQEKDWGTKSWERSVTQLHHGIISPLCAAEALDPSTRDKKWDFYLVSDGKYPDVNDNSTQLNAFRTLVYAVRASDEVRLRRIFDPQPVTRRQSKELDDLIALSEKYQPNREFERDILDTNQWQLFINRKIMENIREKSLDDGRHGNLNKQEVKELYDIWKAGIQKFVAVRSSGAAETLKPFPYLATYNDIIFIPKERGIVFVCISAENLTMHKSWDDEYSKSGQTDVGWGFSVTHK